MKPDKPEVIPGFLDSRYPAFYVQFKPLEPARANILYLPPFAEEMNRCRSVVAEQARRFTRCGFNCTLLDFFGTGESPGEFEEANLDIWRRNIAEAVEDIQKEHTLPLVLWGFRLGGLIALDFLQQTPQLSAHVLLWQPVTNGRTYLTQVLRQRTASLLERGLPGETTDQIRQRLTAGEKVEVAGYMLAGELCTQLDSLAIDKLQPEMLDQRDIVWLEHTSSPESALGARSQRAVDHLVSSGARTIVHQFTGPQLWQLHERDQCPDLIARTPTEFS